MFLFHTQSRPYIPLLLALVIVRRLYERMDKLDDLQVRIDAGLLVDRVLETKARSARLLIRQTKSLTAPLIPPPIGADMKRYNEGNQHKTPCVNTSTHEDVAGKVPVHFGI